MSRHTRSPARALLLAVSLLGVFVVLNELLWTRANVGASVLGDDLTLLNQSLYYLDGWAEGHLWHRLVPDARVSAPYPPLVPLWGALHLRVLGRGMVSLLISHWLWWVIALLGAALAARGGARLAAVALVPLVMRQPGFTDHFFTELALSALCLASVALLAASVRFTRPRWAALLGVALGLGLLAKWTFAFFLGPPMVLACAHALSRPPAGVSRGRVLAGVAITAAGVLLVAAPWYLASHQALLRFLTLNTGHTYEGDILPLGQVWGAYPRWLGECFLGTPLLLLLALGAVRALLPGGSAVARWSLACLVSGLTLLTLAPYLSHRYLVAGLGLLVPLMVEAVRGRGRGQGVLVVGIVLASVLHQVGWAPLPWNTWARGHWGPTVASPRRGQALGLAEAEICQPAGLRVRLLHPRPARSMTLEALLVATATRCQPQGLRGLLGVQGPLSSVDPLRLSTEFLLRTGVSPLYQGGVDSQIARLRTNPEHGVALVSEGPLDWSGVGADLDCTPWGVLRVVLDARRGRVAGSLWQQAGGAPVAGRALVVPAGGVALWLELAGCGVR